MTKITISKKFIQDLIEEEIDEIIAEEYDNLLNERRCRPPLFGGNEIQDPFDCSSSSGDGHDVAIKAYKKYGNNESFEIKHFVSMPNMGGALNKDHIESIWAVARKKKGAEMPLVPHGAHMFLIYDKANAKIVTEVAGEIKKMVEKAGRGLVFSVSGAQKWDPMGYGILITILASGDMGTIRH